MNASRYDVAFSFLSTDEALARGPPPIPQGKGSVMATVFRGYSEFRNATLTCPKCAWSGQGRQTEVGEVFEDGMVSEYHCPKCSEYLAVAPWPRIGESRE